MDVSPRLALAAALLLPAGAVLAQPAGSAQQPAPLVSALDADLFYQLLLGELNARGSEPATGYGYIRVGEPLPPPAGVKKYKTVFHRAEQFVEKPNYDTALGYLQSGQYRWNAGMFIWSFVTVTEGLQKHQPEMYEACQRWFKVANQPARLAKVLSKEYPGIKKISIDYALMEHAHNVVVADGAFEWDDLGAWNALSRHLKADPEGNCAVGQMVHVDGARNLIFDARTRQRTRFPRRSRRSRSRAPM